MGLQMGLGSSNTLPLGRQRGSVSFQVERSDIWVTCLITKGRGTARAAETPCLGTWSPAVSAGWEKKGLCLWATFQAQCPTDTSPRPAPLLMVLQKPVPCLPLPHLKRSSASWEVLIRSCRSQSLWSGELLRGSSQEHEPPCVRLAVLCLYCANCDKSMEIWLAQCNIKKKPSDFGLEVNMSSKLTHCRKSVQSIHI